MPSTTYKIDYRAPSGPVVADIDKVESKLVALDKVIDRVRGKLAKLGSDSKGLKLYGAELVKLDAELKSKVRDAAAAEAALRKVGGNTRALAAMERRLVALTAKLQAMQAAAASAAAAGASVGAGGPAPNGATGQPSASGKAPRKGGGVGAGFLATAVGMMVGKTVGATVVASESRRSWDEAGAEKLLEVQEGLKEYASVMKRPGADARTVREVVQHARDAGSSIDEAATFLTAYEGGITFGRDAGNIGKEVGRDGWTQAQQDALEARMKVVGAQFGTRTGIDPKTAANLASLIPQYKKVQSDVDLAGDLGGFHFGLDQGRGDVSVLARGMAAQAGKVIKSGQISGMPELGAWGGVISGVRNAAAVGTGFSQVNRLLNVSGGEGGAEFLREIGADKVPGNYAKLGKIKQYVEKNGIINVPEMLKSKGFKNSTDIGMTTALLGLYDTLGKRIEEGDAYSRNGADVLRRNDENQREQMVAARRSAANLEVSQIETGLLAQPLETAMASARAKMGDPTRAGDNPLKVGFWQSILDISNSAWTGFGRSGEDIRVEKQAYQTLIEEGKKVKVDVRERFPNLAWAVDHSHPLDPTTAREDFRRAAEMVTKAGGNPYGSVGRQIVQGAQQLMEAGKQLEAERRRAGERGGDAGAAPAEAGRR